MGKLRIIILGFPFSKQPYNFSLLKHTLRWFQIQSSSFIHVSPTPCSENKGQKNEDARYLNNDDCRGTADTGEQSIEGKERLKYPLYRPVSVLGGGEPEKPKFWRSTINRENKVHVKDVNPDAKALDELYDIPLCLRLQHKKNPIDTEKLYPELNDLIKHDAVSEPAPDNSSLPNFPHRAKIMETIEEQKYQENSPALNNNKSGEIQEIPELNKSLRQLEETVSGYVQYLEDNNVDHISFCADGSPLVHEIKDEVWRLNYGSPDPSIPASKTPCGGCGSFLHCQNVSIPGYVPSERFIHVNQSKLHEIICQRCMFLKEHNVALNVNVPNQLYPSILSKLKNRSALVLLLVDLTDFPCSIWPGIVNIIGKDCPIIVVGTKADLLPRDENRYLSRAVDALSQSLKEYGIDRGENITAVHLVSAKTGFGVESLITKIHKTWDYKGDVFLVGCTNVGKSTLFNALLQSDLCHFKAVDLIQRATTSVWPGTTLNLLKFPMQRPSGFREVHRKGRLAALRKAEKAERALQLSTYSTTRDPKFATLMGRIGVTKNSPTNHESLTPRQTFYDPNDRRFSRAYFCYDTPGSVYQDQIIDLLTVEELMKTIPKEIIIPRTFSLKTNQSLFLAGLARIDIVEIESLENLLVTVFSSSALPVHIIGTEDADSFYSQNLGSLLEVPCGDSRRVALFPKLQPLEYHCIGTNFDESAADIVLSSAGWVSLTIKGNKFCRIKAYTPEGRGCYLRQPALLPYAVRLKGKKIRSSPAFQNIRCSVDQ